MPDAVDNRKWWKRVFVPNRAYNETIGYLARFVFLAGFFSGLIVGVVLAILLPVQADQRTSVVKVNRVEGLDGITLTCEGEGVTQGDDFCSGPTGKWRMLIVLEIKDEFEFIQNDCAGHCEEREVLFPGQSTGIVDILFAPDGDTELTPIVRSTVCDGGNVLNADIASEGIELFYDRPCTSGRIDLTIGLHRFLARDSSIDITHLIDETRRAVTTDFFHLPACNTAELSQIITREAAKGFDFYDFETYYIRINGKELARQTFVFCPSQDLDDHGNDIDNATSIELNSPTHGSIEYSRDVDYFRIIVPSSSRLFIATSGETDTFGRLFSSGGFEIANSGDLKSRGNNFAIIQELAFGTYYIAVHHNSSRGTGDYVLQVTQTQLGG